MEDRRGGKGVLLCFCKRKAFAAWVYASAAPSHFSCRPPKRLKPVPAEEAALSAYEYISEAYRHGGVERTFCRRARGSCAMFLILSGLCSV